MAKFLLPSILAMWSAGATAATLIEEATTKLTGGSSREWVFKQIRTSMGPGEACSQGETYRFASDRSLTIEQCVDGKINKTAKTWSMEQSGPLDIVIEISGTPFILMFRDAGTTHFMRLRTPAESKLDPTTDREFRLSED
jgi:hypothetical protein